MDVPSSATTILTQEPPAAALGTQLSRANLFGFFVTLQICQLTQPHGSLLFRRVNGVLWRMNPACSSIEACIIVRHLARPLWDLCKTLPSRLTLTWRKAQKDGLSKGLRSFSMPWREHLCDPASALLLLRSAMSYAVDAELMQKLMDGSFELQEARVGTVTATQSTSSRSGLPPMTALDGGGQDGANSGSRSAETGTGTELRALTPARPVISQYPGVQRRWTELELGPSSSPQRIIGALAANSDVNSERVKLLHRAFGSNALAHGEKQIDIVTTTATLLILLKLLIIHQAPWFTAYALMTICGWIAVQALLLLFHSREMGDVDMMASIRQARLINEHLLKTAYIWESMYLMMHMPILGYVSYLVAFRFHMPNGLHWLGTIFTFFWLMYSGVFVVSGGMLLTIGGAIGMIFYLFGFLSSGLLYVGRREISDLDEVIEALIKSLGCALASSVSAWVLLGYLTYIAKWSALYNPEKYGPFEPVFGRHSTLNMLVDEGFHNAMLGLLFLIVLCCLSMGFWGLLIDNDSSSAAERQYLISGGNILLTVAVFTWYLVTYDAKGTYKPPW